MAEIVEMTAAKAIRDNGTVGRGEVFLIAATIGDSSLSTELVTYYAPKLTSANKSSSNHEDTP